MLARGDHLRGVPDGPLGQRAQRATKRPAEIGQLIFHSRGHDFEDLAMYQPVGLQVAQGLREHLLADAHDTIPDSGETTGLPIRQLSEHQNGPLVAYPIKKISRGTPA